MINSRDKKILLVQTFPKASVLSWQCQLQAYSTSSILPFLHNKLQLSAAENLKMCNRHHALRVLARAMCGILLSNRDLLQTNPSICFTLKILVWQVCCWGRHEANLSRGLFQHCILWPSPLAADLLSCLNHVNSQAWDAKRKITEGLQRGKVTMPALNRLHCQTPVCKGEKRC